MPADQERVICVQAIAEDNDDGTVMLMLCVTPLTEAEAERLAEAIQEPLKRAMDEAIGEGLEEIEDDGSRTKH